jgi:hypothetical protein
MASFKAFAKSFGERDNTKPEAMFGIFLRFAKDLALAHQENKIRTAKLNKEKRKSGRFRRRRRQTEEGEDVAGGEMVDDQGPETSREESNTAAPWRQTVGPTDAVALSMVQQEARRPLKRGVHKDVPVPADEPEASPAPARAVPAIPVATVSEKLPKEDSKPQATGKSTHIPGKVTRRAFYIHDLEY